MCCFSGPVESVSNTNIFARRIGKAAQFVVYSMHVKSASEVAMILPIPVDRDAGDQAVQFVNLEEYPKLFRDLDRGFPRPPTKNAKSQGRDRAVPEPQAIPVVEVGAYEASFVPSINDFGQLDERFRLPADTWAQLPSYGAYGFTVFQLKKGDVKFHPMAFRFASAVPQRLFFPTVHIHDGKVHPQARFDHALYCQVPDGDLRTLRGWDESPQPAGMFVKVDKSKQLIDGDAHVYRRRMRGRMKNDDTWA